jgi:hypothetical protein
MRLCLTGDHNNYVFPPPALVGTDLQYARDCQAKLTLVFLEWYSRPYMNILLPPTGNPFLIDKVYLGYSLDILEYRTMDPQSRVQHKIFVFLYEEIMYMRIISQKSGNQNNQK